MELIDGVMELTNASGQKVVVFVGGRPTSADLPGNTFRIVLMYCEDGFFGESILVREAGHVPYRVPGIRRQASLPEIEDIQWVSYETSDQPNPKYGVHGAHFLKQDYQSMLRQAREGSKSS